MSAEVQFVAYEGGQLHALASGEKGREAVLALPLNRLLVKMVRVPPAQEPVEFCLPVLQAISPFPDDKLTVSCETVRETESGTVLIAAALPESAADDIGEALDGAKLNIVRIDALVLGQLRGVWSALGESSGRRLVLVRSVDCLSLVVLDGDQPSAIRAISDAADLRREVMLSLLEAEDFGGARKLEEIIVVESDGGGESVNEKDKSDARGESDESALVSQDPLVSPVKEDLAASLSAFAPVRTLRVGSDAALVGVAERSRDEGSLNALPESWREVLEETRFKAKMVRHLAVAGAVWLLVMGTLFGVPLAFDFMTGRQKDLSKRHARQFKEVKEMKAKVDLIHKYSDHARGALEIMKALSDRLPEGVTLSSWDFRRDDGVRVRGDAETAEAVYSFKDAMDALSAGEEGEGEPIFGEVILTGPNASKGGYSFNLDCQYQKGEEE